MLIGSAILIDSHAISDKSAFWGFTQTYTDYVLIPVHWYDRIGAFIKTDTYYNKTAI